MADVQLYKCDLCSAFAYTLEGLLGHLCQDTVASALSLATESQSQPSPSSLNLTEANLRDLSVSPPPCEELEKWEDRDVRLLITCYTENKHHFNSKGRMKKKEVFSKIAVSFNCKSQKKVTSEQCQRKWQKLEAKYKEVEDHNSQTGNDKKKWKFLREMEACMDGSPQIRPAFTFDSSTGSNCSSPAPVDENDDTTTEGTDSCTEESEGKKVKLPTRKRKSHSSAAEMLTFMQSYTERKEKAEAEKLELLKNMHEEKKEFFSQFLDILRNKNS